MSTTDTRPAIEKFGAFASVAGLALLGLFFGGNVGAVVGAVVGLFAAA